MQVVYEVELMEEPHFMKDTWHSITMLLNLNLRNMRQIGTKVMFGMPDYLGLN